MAAARRNGAGLHNRGVCFACKVFRVFESVAVWWYGETGNLDASDTAEKIGTVIDAHIAK